MTKGGRGSGRNQWLGPAGILSCLLNQPGWGSCKQGIADDAAADFFNGIDFAQDVSIGKLGRGQRLYGYQMPGRQGRWYSPRVASSPTELGISPWGKLDGSIGTKIHTQYRVTEPTMVLRSRAARVVDFWSAEPFQTMGSAPQLFAPAGRKAIENLGALK
jgi:Bacterial toxin 46